MNKVCSLGGTRAREGTWAAGEGEQTLPKLTGNVRMLQVVRQHALFHNMNNSVTAYFEEDVECFVKTVLHFTL